MLCKRALLIFAYSRYAQTAKILARIFSPYVKKCWATAVCEARPRQGAGALRRHRRHLQTRALRAARLWVWQVRALVRNARNAAARRGAACGRYRGNPMRNAGWLIAGCFAGPRAALLLGTRVLVSKRCFAPPRTGCRFGNARRFGRSGSLCDFGGLCDFAGLAG